MLYWGDFMQTLIKRIRSHLNMSQAELADHLNVTFTTVNRWENGHSTPNKLAQTQLYELCKKHSVPVYQMMLDKIDSIVKTITTSEDRIILYHGSKSGISGHIEPRSRQQCDFGKGFYMGTEPGQALTLICDYEKSKFYIVSIDPKDLTHLEVPANIDWAMLVAYHRGRMEKAIGTPFYNKYQAMVAEKDLIIGNIANDRMFYVIDNFFIGNITDAALVNSLSALQLGKQYVAVTQKGCDAIRIECEVPLSHLERMYMKDISSENRAKGVSLANNICKNYRREGMFFDEILDDAMTGESL